MEFMEANSPSLPADKSMRTFANELVLNSLDMCVVALDGMLGSGQVKDSV